MYEPVHACHVYLLGQEMLIICLSSLPCASWLLVLQFLPQPGTLLLPTLAVSQEARRNAFRVWIADAINKALGALEGEEDFGSLIAHRTLSGQGCPMSSRGAALTYVMFTTKEHDDKWGDMPHAKVQVIRCALRDLLCRCVCREVGFADQKQYVDQVKAAFDPFEEHFKDKQLYNIMSQMSHTFQQETRLLKIANSWDSNVKKAGKYRKQAKAAKSPDANVESKRFMKVVCDSDSGCAYVV